MPLCYCWTGILYSGAASLEENAKALRLFLSLSFFVPFPAITAALCMCIVIKLEEAKEEEAEGKQICDDNNS